MHTGQDLYTATFNSIIYKLINADITRYSNVNNHQQHPAVYVEWD